MPVLVVLFIAVPILELFLIIQVGQAIGVLPTIALLIADSILGSVLMRSQGRAAWRRFNAAIAEGRVPGREVIDGALIIFGGALLLTPGFFTDVFGLILLLPHPRDRAPDAHAQPRCPPGRQRGRRRAPRRRRAPSARPV